MYSFSIDFFFNPDGGTLHTVQHYAFHLIFFGDLFVFFSNSVEIQLWKSVIYLTSFPTDMNLRYSQLLL